MEFNGQVVLWVGTGIITVMWWLLRNKDAQQQKEVEAMKSQIELLFKKHDDDSARLDQFQIKIAENHYAKPELDARFDKLEVSIRDGLRELGAKLDKISDVLIQTNRKENH